MAATYPNPFTKVLEQLWTLLEADTQFTDRIPPANRVKYDSTTDNNPIKQIVATADLPEFAVAFGGAAINLFDSSSSTKVVSRWMFVINTGDWRVNEFAQVLNWIVLCNLRQWKTGLGALTWKGETFVKRVHILDLASGESDPNRNRQIKGWTSVFNLEIEMHFKTTNLVFSESP